MTRPVQAVILSGAVSAVAGIIYVGIKLAEALRFFRAQDKHDHCYDRRRK